MLSFQRECQRRSNEQVKSEMSRFRERELAAMRLACEDKMHEEVGKSRRQFEAFYQERLKGLQQRERNLMEGMKKREIQLDATLFTQRQKILDELESVKNREAEARRLLEAEDKGMRGERERLMCLEQNLKLRELNIENTNKQRAVARQEVLTIKQIELEKEYEDKLNQLQIQEATLKEEKRSLSQLEGICSHQIKETAELRSQLYKLQEAVHISTESQLRAERDKAILTDKLERMGDYNVLRSETARLENELFALRHELVKNTAIHEEKLRDYETLISELRFKLQQPSGEVHELRNKLATEKHGFEREQILNQQENIQLRVQLETALHQQKCLKETLRDHQGLVKQLNQELSELRVRTANKNNTRANTAREITPFDLRSSIRSQTTHSAPVYAPYKEQPDLLHRPKSNRVRIKLPTETVLNETADLSHASSDISFVQEAKASLERLEREAQELELSYKQVHSRILRGTTGDTHQYNFDFSQDQIYTSTIDPNAYTPQLNPIIEIPNSLEIQLFSTTSIHSDKPVSSFPLSSLTDINLTAGIYQSCLGEERSTDIISSITTQDNFPSIPSLTQLLSIPTQTSVLSNNRDELSIVSEVTSDSPKQSPLKIPHQPGTSNEVPDPIKLFHQLQHTSNYEESAYSQETPHIPVDQSHKLIDPLFPIVDSNQQAGTEQISTDIQVNPATNQPIEFIPLYPDVHAQSIPIIPTVASVSPDTIRTTSAPSPSSRAIARGKAVREAIEESERIEIMQEELEKLESIPLQGDTPDKLIEKVESTFIPDNSTILQLDEAANPIEKLESTIIPSTLSIPLYTPVITKENEITDPMSKYMQLLTTNPTPPEKDTLTAKPNDDVSIGFDVSLNSEEPAVSFGAFSDAEKSDPFTDW